MRGALDTLRTTDWDTVRAQLDEYEEDLRKLRTEDEEPLEDGTACTALLA